MEEIRGTVYANEQNVTGIVSAERQISGVVCFAGGDVTKAYVDEQDDALRADYELLDEAANGRIYDMQIIEKTGTQTVPANALSKAVVTYVSGAGAVRTVGKNLLNLQSVWNNNAAYQEMPLGLANGTYTWSAARNLCNKTNTPYGTATYAVYINKSGLTTAGSVASGAVKIGNTGSIDEAFFDTQKTFSVSEPVSLYVYFAGVRPKPDNYLEILDNLFGTMQIEAGSTASDHVPYKAPVTYTITNDWDGVIAVEAGGSVEFLQSGSVVSVQNTVAYRVGKTVVTPTQLNEALATKQDVISDLSTIRSGASAGADALPKNPDNWPTMTDAQQDTACAVVGAERAKGEWVLKGTMTDPNGISVDLTGCTELLLYGTLIGTGVTSMTCNFGTIAFQIVANGNRKVYARYADALLGFDSLFVRYASDINTSVISNSIATVQYSYANGSKISGITRLGFYTPSVLTSCSIQIYAR